MTTQSQTEIVEEALIEAAEDFARSVIEEHMDIEEESGGGDSSEYWGSTVYEDSYTNRSISCPDVWVEFVGEARRGMELREEHSTMYGKFDDLDYSAYDTKREVRGDVLRVKFQVEQE